MKNILFIFGLIVVINLPVSGTGQIPDNIIYNGKLHYLKGKGIFDDCYPMESFFEKYPDKRPKVDESLSSLWRNYIATYEIKDNQLYLKDIEIFDNGLEMKSILNEIFPNQELIKIDWLTRLLVIPDGQRNKYYDYKRYIILEINEGNIMREKQIDIDENFMKESQEDKFTEYELFKKRQYDAFKNTNEYNKVMYQIKAQNLQDTIINNHDTRIKYNIFEYSSKILVE